MIRTCATQLVYILVCVSKKCQRIIAGILLCNIANNGDFAAFANYYIQSD